MRRCALVCALAVLLTPAQARGAPRSIFPLATTTLLSRSYDGGAPNGPSRNAAISGDSRDARLIAFESDASDIVRGDANGHSDVFVVHRAEPYAPDGSPWAPGGTGIVSTGPGGRPANGPSYRPALSGTSRAVPACVAFISEASNLVSGDTNGVADAFVRDLRSGRITRVSVNSRGEQANGQSFEVSVDGDCDRVAFSSTASNLALVRTRRKGWLGARTSRPPHDTRQVYVRFIATAGPDRPLRGLTLLASASNRQRAGNGHSREPAFARSGTALVFSSTATNLSHRDRTPASDVYRRSIERRFRRFRRGRPTQSLRLSTRLVSITRSGVAGNGASSSPTATDDGRLVAYETAASDLVRRDRNRVRDVVRADMTASPAAQLLISKTSRAIGNGASRRPAISGAGHSVLFDSQASNLKMFPWLADDMNGVRDVFIGVVGHRSASPESLTTAQRQALAPSGNVAASAKNNYIAFESTDRMLDPSAPNPGRLAVYLRYLGPK